MNILELLQNGYWRDQINQPPRRMVRRLGCTQILTRDVLMFQGLAIVAVYLGVFENGGTIVVGKMMINH